MIAIMEGIFILVFTLVIIIGWAFIINDIIKHKNKKHESNNNEDIF